MRPPLELVSSPVGGRLLVDEKRGAGWCVYVDTLPLLPGRDEGAQRMVNTTAQSVVPDCPPVHDSPEAFHTLAQPVGLTVRGIQTKGDAP